MVGCHIGNSNSLRYDMVATYIANDYFNCCFGFNFDVVFFTAVGVFYAVGTVY